MKGQRFQSLVLGGRQFVVDSLGFSEAAANAATAAN
jgi:hypothetical protein